MGAGGIGMSALARSALDRGAKVSGCDLVDRPTLQPLRRAGMKILLGHSPLHVKDQDILVYTKAIPGKHPELAEAERAGVETLSREHFLARVMDGAYTVGVTGAHGKTTTTWLIAKILLEAGLDPTVFVGGIVDEIGGNFRSGKGNLFVAEVDESGGIVEDFTARMAVVTNVDDEHLDRFSGKQEMAEAVRSFAARSGPEGRAVMWTGDPVLREISAGLPADVEVITVSGEAGSDYRLDADAEPALLKGPGDTTVVLDLPLPGRHNLINASLASVCALGLGVTAETIRKALAKVQPVKRRQNRMAVVGGVYVYDDYAHHPTEIRATLEALRPLVKGRMTAVFQPHRYTRTKALMERFAQALSLLDTVILLDVYAAGEEPIRGVNSARLAELLIDNGRNAQYISNRRLAAEHAVGIARPGDAIVTLGAGNVGDLCPEIIHLLSLKNSSTTPMKDTST